MRTTVEVVYAGHDNSVELTLSYYDGNKFVPLDFGAVERMVLIFPEVQPMIVFDSQQTAGVINWLLGGGKIRFDIARYALPPGGYVAELIAYDPLHPNGQVLIDRYENNTVFEFREVNSAGILPPPLPENGSALVRLAGEEISALRVLYEYDGQVYYLDLEDEVNIFRWIGIALNAAAPGEQVTIQRSGSLEDNSWNWIDGERVYLGHDGFLTQTVPVVGYQQLIGTAVSAKRILLNIQDPIEL